VTSLGEADQVTIFRIDPGDSIRSMNVPQGFVEYDLRVDSLTGAMIQDGGETVAPTSGMRGFSFAAHLSGSLDKSCVVNVMKTRTGELERGERRTTWSSTSRRVVIVGGLYATSRLCITQPYHVHKRPPRDIEVGDFFGECDVDTVSRFRGAYESPSLGTSVAFIGRKHELRRLGLKDETHLQSHTASDTKSKP
jgi:hypothetical protein